MGNWFATWRDKINSGLGRGMAIAAACVVLGVAVAIAVSQGGRNDAAKRQLDAKGYKAQYVCTACGDSGELVLHGEKFPVECPQCHQKQAVAAFRCAQPGCNTLLPAKSGLVQCPRCHRTYDFREVPGGGGELPPRQ